MFPGAGKGVGTNLVYGHAYSAWFPSSRFVRTWHVRIRAHHVVNVFVLDARHVQAGVASVSHGERVHNCIPARENIVLALDDSSLFYWRRYSGARER